MKPNGLVVANFIVSPNFTNAFAKRIDNTFRTVFPNVGRQVVSDNYNAWNDEEQNVKNVIYSYRHDRVDDTSVYTNNNNTAAFDKPDRPHNK